jgi:hypothetical protein
MERGVVVPKTSAEKTGSRGPSRAAWSSSSKSSSSSAAS